MKNESAASSVSLMAAFAASLCCITPLIALVAGASGAASSMAWLEPFRPYLIGVAVLALGFAWVLSLRTDKAASYCADGNCTVQKKSFLASKAFLLLITVATVLVIAFPYYAKELYPKPPYQKAAVIERGNIHTVIFTIKGMTCGGCEAHVNSELAKVNGVLESITSYPKRNSVVRFDETKTNVQHLQAAFAKTGYHVVATKLETNGSNN